jgi:hypothetical protein
MKRPSVAATSAGEKQERNGGMKMTFKEATEEMKILVGGRDWAFQYKVASYLDGPQIHGYIADIGHAMPSQTCAGAIENVKRMLNSTPIDPPDEAPEDELKNLKDKAADELYIALQMENPFPAILNSIYPRGKE